MMEFPPALIGSSSATTIPTILVDSRAACMKEAGEIVHQLHSNQIGAADLIELGSIVADDAGWSESVPVEERLRLRKGGRSLYKSVGIGCMDVEMVALVVRLAEEKNIGTVMDY